MIQLISKPKLKYKTMTLNEGDRVLWQYTHAIGRNKFERVKEGTFLGMTGSRKSKRYVSGTHAKVIFDGNKTVSRVPVKELFKDNK